MSWFFAKESKPEEQGAFCDCSSQVVYSNQSKSETLNAAARFQEETGSAVSMRDDSDPKRSPDSTRFNTAILDMDERGTEYPPKLGPGK